MAIAELMNQMDFLEKLKEADPKRYEMWIGGREAVLVPIVTSHNVHTFIFKYDNKEQMEEFKRIFQGNVIDTGKVKFH